MKIGKKGEARVINRSKKEYVSQAQTLRGVLNKEPKESQYT